MGRFWRMVNMPLRLISISRNWSGDGVTANRLTIVRPQILSRGALSSNELQIVICRDLTPWQGTCSSMMTSSNENIFRVTGPLRGEFTGHRWIPLTKASDVELWCFLWSAPWINSWVNNREAGDLWCNRAHYDVIVMDLTGTTSDTSLFWEIIRFSLWCFDCLIYLMPTEDSNWDIHNSRHVSNF